MNEQKMEENAVKLVLALEADRALVWKAWTQAEHMGWFGSDPNGIVRSAQADVRVGGAYRVTFENSDGSVYTCFGEYRRVAPERLLEFTWSWAGREDHVELVRVVFESSENGTIMTFDHHDIDPDTSHGYEEGWLSCFGKLERELAKSGAQ